MTFSENNSDNNIATHQNFNFYPFFVVVTMLWALIVYSLIAWYSYEGFKYFQHPFGSIGDNANDEEDRLIRDRETQNSNNNYGAVNYGNRNQGDAWSGQSYRNNGYGLSSAQSGGGQKVTPFSGRGTVVGGG
jgi:hypothetical protein